ncbi:MAG TPA: FAD-binding oxidoreductase, partial [Planctomycetaceae bacterium]|nr:FAD-binding oxidoreductase [Planctomycetaceae bacterium]
MTSPAQTDRPATVSAELIDALRTAVGSDAVISDPDELLVYECDAYVIDKQAPDVVVFPEIG